MTEQTQPTYALAKLRHLYANMTNGGVRDTASAKRIAEGLLSPAIEALEKWGTPAGAVEPTEAMIDAGNRARLYREHGDLREEAVLSARTHNTRATWFAMCEAAPQAQAGAVPQYRLLQSGVDRIEAADEFLSDDTKTWAIDPNGIFVGNIYGGQVLRPARRARLQQESPGGPDVDHPL